MNIIGFQKPYPKKSKTQEAKGVRVSCTSRRSHFSKRERTGLLSSEAKERERQLSPNVLTTEEGLSSAGS